MLSGFGLAVLAGFLIGTAVILALAVLAGAGRSDCTIARILYDAEQSGKTR